MNEAIIPGSSAVEFATKERCWIAELSNGDHDPAVSIARARAGGSDDALASFARDRRALCDLQGTGVVEVGELPEQRVHTGDVVIIPPSCRQRITAEGAEDLVFLAICTPRFRIEAYENIEG